MGQFHKMMNLMGVLRIKRITKIPIGICHSELSPLNTRKDAKVEREMRKRFQGVGDHLLVIRFSKLRFHAFFLFSRPLPAFFKKGSGRLTLFRVFSG
jgi:hypothetical protein